MKNRARELWRAVKGDGCTSVPDFTYTQCCTDHDRHYTLGTHRNGKPITRAESDAALRKCMQARGKTPIVGRFIVPWIYWAGVRMFGGSHWSAQNENMAANIAADNTRSADRSGGNADSGLRDITLPTAPEIRDRQLGDG